MITLYETRGWIKYAEEDVYANGCQPETGSAASGSDGFAAETVDVLIQKLQEFVGSTSDVDVLRDSCDEPGRVDVQVYETDDASPATPEQIKRWKRGEVRLWLATYTFHVQRVTRETVSVAPAVPIRRV